MTAASDFQNPLSGTAYRLRVDDVGTWRITKSVQDHGSVIVRHLRGRSAPGCSPPADAVDLLVRGGHQAVDQVAADPAVAFAEVVLLDLDRTSTILTALAREARQRRLDGLPGFRPGCRHLRDQEAAAMDRAVDGCRRLAAAWSSTGFEPAIGLPAWLEAAVGDGRRTSSVDPRHSLDRMSL